MLDEIQHIVYQVLIVIFPMLIYHLFFHEKAIQRRKASSKLTIILAIMLVMTMTFPVEFSKGYYYDFRMIPFLIAFFYGGVTPGIMISAILIAYRYFLGGDGFYVILLNYSLASVLMSFVSSKYKLMRMKMKLLVVSGVFWLITFMVAGTLILMERFEQIHFMFIFYGCSWVSLILVVFVIENVNQQISIREELQRAEKLNVISQLAASVAHEVRNPMTSVNGFLQLMRDDHNLLNSQKNYINIALNELSHAQSIINDYLALAKPHTEELTDVNISKEVNKTIELMTSYSNIQNIIIKSDIQEELYIKGNKDEIKQVLVNIIKNGIEAMESYGILTVKTFAHDFRIYIEITDTGKGMSKAQLKNIGRPFYTTKEKGTGVGMTISFQLIHAMKGKVAISSEVNKGTKVTISFPQIFIEDLS
ncbi:ATP-binding protein [Falsibacillus albus]|uniref:histidine kinase n=1 Tax=Falsibacillus albus TaxID=2478915 RepID=A0A3L7K1R2_9BACI|nr:ATP-binding protein [Falsibacillus albus]RLQ96329.1 sporulation kinase [Falsibacillus albus]